MTIPPVKKKQIFAAGRETGQGVDKTDSRAHVMGVVYMADERKPEVKKITRSKPYKEIEKDPVSYTHLDVYKRQDPAYSVAILYRSAA